MKERNERVTEELSIENARLIFRNFSGEEQTNKGRIMNAKGDRNFGIILTEELAKKLDQDGWRVRRLKPMDDDPEQYHTPWLKVKVKFGRIPPIVNIITSRGRTRLDENTVGSLDWAYIKNVDLVIRPYNYPAINDKPAGVSAYLKSIYVTIQEDNFAEKYADIPEVE